MDLKTFNLSKINNYKTIHQLTFPIAKRPLSKKNSTPRKRKNTPKPDTPMPISAHKMHTTLIIIIIIIIKGADKNRLEIQSRIHTLIVCYR